MSKLGHLKFVAAISFPLMLGGCWDTAAIVINNLDLVGDTISTLTDTRPIHGPEEPPPCSDEVKEARIVNPDAMAHIVCGDGQE